MKAGILATLALAGTMHSAQADALDKSMELITNLQTINRERNLNLNADPAILYNCAAEYGLKDFFVCMNEVAKADPSNGNPIDVIKADVTNLEATKEKCEAFFQVPQNTCLLHLDVDKFVEFVADSSKQPPFGGKENCKGLGDFQTGSGRALQGNIDSAEASTNMAEKYKEGLGKLKKFAQECEKNAPGTTTALFKPSSAGAFGASILMSMAAFVGLRVN